MPGAKVFIDSNVILYGRDAGGAEKTVKANDWLRAATAAGAAQANLQVLNEVTHVMLRKRNDLSPQAIFESIDQIAYLGQSPVSDVTVRLARIVREQTSYSWWDCLLLASAIELGCTHFLSEDLQDGQTIEGPTSKGLTIIDPFAHTPEQILVSP